VIAGELSLAGPAMMSGLQDGTAYIWQQLDEMDMDLLTIENIKPRR
jgi:hypothetical protein